MLVAFNLDYYEPRCEKIVLTSSESKQRAAAQLRNARVSRSAYAFQLFRLAWSARASPGGISSTTSRLVAAIAMTSIVKA